MTTFAKLHKDFVLKLKFLGEGDEVSQVRRVRLPRIVKDNLICYEELVGIAISFVIPQHPSSASDFQVKLKYQDVDNDTIVIGSSEELLDAIDQFSDQRVLRIDAEVKPFVKAAASLLPSSNYVCEVVPPSGPSFTSVSSAARVQSGSSSSPRSSPIIQNVVESVVNVILNAAVAMNSRGNQQSVNPLAYSPDGIPAPTTVASTWEDRTLEAPADSANVKSQTSYDIPVENLAPSELAAAFFNPSTEETGAEGHKKPSAINERPFIHGCHTCDSCLTTPIVGKRYHAVNLSDYDLCEKCYGNYKGGEILFEAVELDRDRHLQVRWNRRRDRMNNCRGRGAGHGRRLGAGVGHHTRWGSASGPSHGHPRSGSLPGIPLPPHVGHPLPCHSMETTGKNKEVDGGLDEAMRIAIQMSLQDVEEKKLPPASIGSLAMASHVSPKESMRIFVKTLTGKTVAVDVEPSDSVGDVKIKACAKAAEDDVERTTKRSSVSKPLMVGSTLVLKDEIAKKVLVETVKDEDFMTAPALEPNQPACIEEQVISIMADKANTDAAVISEGFVIPMQPDSSSVSSRNESERTHESPTTPKDKSSSREKMSFSSEAAGNGDVADLLGSTLDRCAEAIDAMVTELSREYGDNHSVSSSIVGLQNPCDEVDNMTDDGVEGEGPQTILESIPSPQGQHNEGHSESAKSEEDWHVVSEELQIGGDEELARAAQMIGSALFNSDIRSSQEQMSTLSGSTDGVSFASSVPTSVPSISSNIVVAQLERWALQLGQLHAMGFNDDARCVEILERLSAANIGCGSHDEVSVSEVVNELWKN